MQSSPLSFLLAFILVRLCFPGVYKINVQQGNIVTDEELTELSEACPEVRFTRCWEAR